MRFIIEQKTILTFMGGCCMLNLIKITCILFFVAGSTVVQACMGPDNVFGIRFNDNEPIDLGVIETLGEENVNYIKSAGNSYKFRSHYNSAIMVQISAISLFFTIDTSIIPLQDFPYSECIDNELYWLSSAGIISMNRINRDKIVVTFSLYQYPGHFYWTKQDTLLGSDASIDSSGTIVLMDCGGGPFNETDLPPEELSVASGVLMDNIKSLRSTFVNQVNDRASIINVDLRGRTCHRQVSGLKTAGSVPGIVFGYNRQTGSVSRILLLSD
jgi:hypothetical protein